MNRFLLKLRIALYKLIDSKNFYIRYCAFKVFINADNSLLNQLFYSKSNLYEEELGELIIDALKKKKGSLFIDVGANVGLISLYVKSKLPAVNILGFEPGPAQFDYFHKTIEYNKIPNVKLLNLALSDTAGETSFFTHTLEHNSGDGFADTGRAGEGVEIKVKTIRLDDFLSSNNPDAKVGVIKIDTEGAELLVLNGAQHILKEQKPTIFIEIWEANIKNYPYSVKDLFDHFIQMNYSLYTLNGDSVTLDNFDQFKEKESMYMAKSSLV